MLLVFKILLLAAALKVHDIKEQALPSALLFGLPLLLLSMIFAGSVFYGLINGAVSFALAYAYFWLLSSVPNGTPYYAVMGIGGVLLVGFF